MRHNEYKDALLNNKSLRHSLNKFIDGLKKTFTSITIKNAFLSRILF